MEITYEWKVTSMKVTDTDLLENVVIQTYWTKTGTDELGNEGVFSGATPIKVSSIDPDTFVPYENLTQEIVIGWVQEEVKGQKHIDEQILKQINIKRNPVVEKPLPWDPSSNNDIGNGEM